MCDTIISGTRVRKCCETQQRDVRAFSSCLSDVTCVMSEYMHWYSCMLYGDGVGPLMIV